MALLSFPRQFSIVLGVILSMDVEVELEMIGGIEGGSKTTERILPSPGTARRSPAGFKQAQP